MFSEYFFFPKKQTLFGYSDLVKNGWNVKCFDWNLKKSCITNDASTAVWDLEVHEPSSYDCFWLAAITKMVQKNLTARKREMVTSPFVTSVENKTITTLQFGNTSW